jgi:hypothetical protein
MAKGRETILNKNNESDSFLKRSLLIVCGKGTTCNCPARIIFYLIGH